MCDVNESVGIRGAGDQRPKVRCIDAVVGFFKMAFPIS
jgi:hypothetical protein